MVDVIIEFCKQLKAQEHGTLVRNGSNRASKAGADRIQMLERGSKPATSAPASCEDRHAKAAPNSSSTNSCVGRCDENATDAGGRGRGKKCNREHGSAW